MAELVWDQEGKRTYETGVSKAVLFPMGDNGEYSDGVAWSGITGITESPSGAEATALYADNIKYLNLVSAEELGATIEAYTYPDEFAECDGSASLVDGVTIGQQDRKTFALCYSTIIGNDTKSNGYGEKIHILYGCLAAPSEKSFATVNDSPEAITFSWEVKTTPVNVAGHKPTALITIDTTKVDPEKLAAFKEYIYGSTSGTSKCPLPDKVAELLGAA